MQVEREHYRFSGYVNGGRWMSYYYQIKEALESGCRSFLLIGVGDGIVPVLLEKILHQKEDDGEPSHEYFKYIVDTFDFDGSLSPTYTGDIRDLDSVVKKTYDCVICCQVLEHLEWQYFESIVEKMSRVCTEKVILSLPVRGFSFSAILDFPKFHHKFLHFVFPRFWEKKLPWRGEHYWEVGVRGHRRKNVLNVLKKYFYPVRNYFVPENTYHWFVILEKL